jgi:hypothetical protein
VGSPYRNVPTSLWIDELAALPDFVSKGVGAYLRTNSHTNMIGAYYLPLVLAAHELKLDLETLMSAMAKLQEAGIAYYDETTEQVFVTSMAKENIGPTLSRGDGRRKPVQQHYANLRPSYICTKFFETYGGPFNLAHLPEKEPLQSTQPRPAASEQAPSPPPPPAPQPGKTTAEEIEQLLARYTPDQQEQIGRLFRLLAATRKSGRIAENIILARLRKWETLDVRRVMYGVLLYIDRDLHASNKKEQYLWAIMRNATEKELSRPGAVDSGPPLISAVSQRNLLVFEQIRKEREDAAKRVDG